MVLLKHVLVKFKFVEFFTKQVFLMLFFLHWSASPQALQPLMVPEL